MMWLWSLPKPDQEKPHVYVVPNLELPQFLVQAGYTLSNKKIAVVLPRKIAALSIAKRISN